MKEEEEYKGKEKYVTNANSRCLKSVCGLDYLKTRILSYRTERVRVVGGYIGGRRAKARHTSELHMTACTVRTRAPQAMHHRAASHSRDITPPL
jgi:hypothetical protein